MAQIVPRRDRAHPVRSDRSAQQPHFLPRRAPLSYAVEMIYIAHTHSQEHYINEHT